MSPASTEVKGSQIPSVPSRVEMRLGTAPDGGQPLRERPNEESHLSHIYSKLGVRSRIELALSFEDVDHPSHP